MGQRTRNRILEHSGPGHELKKSGVTKAGVMVMADRPEYQRKSFWICKCGWEGWLTNNLNDME
jgi:hypothetical protein